MKKLFSFALFLTTFLNLPNPSFADENRSLICDSFHAVYSPSVPYPNYESWLDYKSRLTVEKVQNLHPGDTEALFILETLSKDDKRVLSRLTMKYGCDGEGNFCQASYEDEKNFPDVALQHDFSVTAPIADNDSSIHAAYALVFPNFPVSVELTQWTAKKKDIEFFTPEKIPPQFNEVWVLTSCKP
jgi:hypothetical protein